MSHIRWVSALACVLLTSCSSDSPTAPFDHPTLHSISYDFQSKRYVTRTPDSSVIRVSATAIFRTPDGFRRLDVTSVTHNGTPLLRRGGDTSEYVADDVPFPIGDRYNVWTVQGTAQIPSLVDSVPAFMIETRIATPLLGDTVSLSKGFTITWQTSPRDSVEVFCFVRSEGVTTDVFEIQQSDEGTIRITPELLRMAFLKPGPITIRVVRLKESDRFAEDKRRVSRRVLSGDSITAYAVE